MVLLDVVNNQITTPHCSLFRIYLSGLIHSLHFLLCPLVVTRIICYSRHLNLFGEVGDNSNFHILILFANVIIVALPKHDCVLSTFCAALVIPERTIINNCEFRALLKLTVVALVDDLGYF